MKQVRQMIQLNEDYALSADSMNIILHQRKVNQKEVLRTTVKSITL